MPDWAGYAGKPVDEIGVKRLEHMDELIQSILQQTHYSNTFIDLILGNLKEDAELSTEHYKQHDINTVVNNCLSHYPFSYDEGLWVNWEPQQSFEFLGDDILMTNVLNNLIKNSLYFIKAAQKGEIYLRTERGTEINTLYFRDTAKGASPEILSHLFQSFYSKRYGGTGLGLAFCKKIMRSFGGDITVESVEGEYMQFTLCFPRIKD